MYGHCTSACDCVWCRWHATQTLFIDCALLLTPCRHGTFSMCGQLTCECECMDIREHAAACLICRVCIALCSACGHCGHAACVIYTGSVFLCTWIRACTPAKFKNICKRRRMHNVECLQSLRMNKGYVIVTIMYMHWIVVIMCTASSGAGVNLLQHWSNEGDSPVWNLCTFTYGLHTTIHILLDWNTNGC